MSACPSLRDNREKRKYSQQSDGNGRFFGRGGLKAYGVRWTSSKLGENGQRRWGEGGGVSEETLKQSRVRGERQRGPWPRYQGQQ